MLIKGIMGKGEYAGNKNFSTFQHIVPTSNPICIKEVAIRTTFCIAGIMYYTCSLVPDSQCTRYKNTFNKRF